VKHHYLAGVAALSMLAAPGFSATTHRSAPPTATASAVSLEKLTSQIKIPYERFTLPNGLRVLVHTDRKAPVVAFSVYYDVGSKQEPKGKTGFAHLFEHLMFGGSENADGSYLNRMQNLGATSMNGSTWFDRTNYYETVPTGALDLTLYLESDRMGHLLGAVTQEKLDIQRGVVQNEKRKNDNQPFGMVGYRQTEVLFPANHPYGHDTIGSMADLDNASIDDVRGWFRQHYGPNNAVVVLAGDIDLVTAKAKIAKYFGDIPRGPAATHPAVTIPTLKRRIDETMTDRVSTTRLYRDWIVPGLNDKDTIPLDIAASVLGGLASSRLDNALVKKEQLAVQVTAGVQQFAQMSQFEVTADVKPGVDPDVVAKRLDEIIADLIERGPTAAEVNRVVTQNAAGTVKSLEPVGGKAQTLAEGLLYSGNPDKYRLDLAAYAAATPASVRSAMQKWLTRPVYALAVKPGARAAYQEAKAATTKPKPAAPISIAKRDPAPVVGDIANLVFPTVTHARFSNGVEIVYAQRTAVPTTQISLIFDAGTAADSIDKQGSARMVTALLKEGTDKLNSIEIAERQEELGAGIGAGSSPDQTAVSLSALTANLAPSLDLLADVALRPAFNPNEVERVRAQMLAGIESEKTNPGALANRALLPAIYGANHPYARIASGTEDSVKAISRDDLVAFHHAWFRPEKAKIFVVSNLPLSALQPQLEAHFGNWRGDGPAGTKSFDVAIPNPTPRIILIDRKDSPQSQILGGMVLASKGTDDNLALQGGADVVGGSFLSRINMDIRETKGWSYGVRAGLGQTRDRISYKISAPVQADQTGPSIAAMVADYHDFLTTRGVTREELERTQNGDVRELPGAFESAGDVLQAMQENDLLGRPDDYYATLAPKVRALTAASFDQAAREAIDPDKLVWVVVGDADKVRPQLEALHMPIESLSAASK
jgi:predicted Zn-dependent peptidase